LPARIPRRPESLKAHAIALLARREHSRAELRDKLLAGRERDAEAVSAVETLLGELTALGFLSDARCAQSFVRKKIGGYSKRAIVAALEAQGIDGDAATDALAGAGIDDPEVLVALWRRRFGAPPASDKDRARQIRFLQSRGFPLSAILKLLRNPPADAGS
jgi:regulatory protein